MRLRSLGSFFLPLAVFIIFTLLWHFASFVGEWPPEIFPSPLQALRTLEGMLRDGSLIKHTVASLFRVTLGYYLAVLLGVPLGILLGWWKPGQTALNPVIQFLRPISPLAWIPLTMIWFGIGDKPAIFLIFLSSFFPLLVSTMSAMNHIRPTFFQVASNFNLSPFETVTKVVFPAILPALLPALRISMGIAWMVVVAAEMIAVKSGLGFLILDARNALRLDLVLNAMAVIGLIGIGLDRAIVQLTKIRSVSWGVH